MARAFLVVAFFGSAWAQLEGVGDLMGTTLGKLGGQRNQSDVVSQVGDMLGKLGGNQSGVVGTLNPKDLLQAGKDARDRVGDQLKKCASGRTSDKKACMEEAKKFMQNMTGKIVNENEMPYELFKAGAGKAGDFIMECIKNSTSQAQKQACRTSDEAKREAALASGKNFSDITDELLRKFARESATGDLIAGMKNCTDDSTSQSQKNTCFKSSGFKQSIADVLGTDASKVMDSTVREFLGRGAKDDMLTMLQNCNKSDSSVCKEEAKALKAKVLGKVASEISDSELEKDTRKAMFQNLGDKVAACMETATDNKKTECKTALARADLKAASLKSNWEPTATDIDMALLTAAKAKVKEVSENCVKSRQECMELLKDAAAKSMGKPTTGLTIMDVENLNMKAAKEAAKDAAEACYEAKEADPSSTCTDPLDKYLEIRKIEKPSDPKRLDALNRKMQIEFLKEMEKEARTLCFEVASKEEADVCLANLTTQNGKVAGNMLEGSDARKVVKLKRAQKEASVEVVGERFHVCMQSAGNSSEKSVCLEDLKQKAVVAGLDEDTDKIAMRFQRKAIADAITSCNTSQRTECRNSIKAELELAGLKPRKFGMLKKLGEIKAAAETWASCKDNATNTDEECAILAAETLEQMSGVSNPWTNETAQEVKSLGQALLNGITTVLRKLDRVDVDAGTTGSACLDAELEALKRKLEEGVASSNFTNISAILNGCQLVEANAYYRASLLATGLNQTSIDQLADVLASVLNGLDLSARRLHQDRRLAIVTEGYADQAVQECAETDASCGGGQGTNTSGSSTDLSTTDVSTTDVSTTNVNSTDVSTTNVKPTDGGGISAAMYHGMSVAVLAALIASA